MIDRSLTREIQKFIDIDNQEVSENLLKHLVDTQTYLDYEDMGEHLYHPSGIVERDYFFIWPSSVQEELQDILKFCEENECAYFRLVNM